MLLNSINTVTCYGITGKRSWQKCKYINDIKFKKHTSRCKVKNGKRK